MKQMFKHFFYLTALLSFAITQADVVPYIAIRSQSRDKVRQVVGVTDLTHLYDTDCTYGLGSILIGYEQTFRPGRIAHCLFGDDLVDVTFPDCNNCNSNCGVVKVQGSNLANRDPRAWLADYFYLPSDFNGSFFVSPRIRNALLDLDFYIGFDSCLCGLYFRAFFPIVNSRWDLNFCELDQVATATTGYSAGYFAPTAIAVSDLLPNFAAYASGLTLANVDGITFQPLRFAKMDNCNRKKTRLADLRWELGWNFLQSDCGHLGINIQGAFPTGNRPSAEFVFEPVVGNGHHWELGGGVTAHYLFTQSETEDCSFGFYLDANFTHLFKAKQCRTFDLCNKPNSRYMLAARLGTPIVNNLSGDTASALTAVAVTAATSQFQNEYAPVANLTTLNVKVSAGVQADVVAWFNYTSCGFSWDFGYDFWGRSCEKFDCNNRSCNSCNNSCTTTIASCTSCPTTNLCNLPRDTWVLKGDAREFGFATVDAGGLALNEAVALSASQSLADIHGGTNAFATPEVAGANPMLTNAGVDNRQFAYAGTNDQRLVFEPGVANLAINHIQTSIQPVFINCEDINYATTRGISHKIFTHFSYTWDCECWIPFLGIGGFAEFGRSEKCNDCPSSCSAFNNNNNCNRCKTCSDCAISQWGIWVKGGIAWQ